MKHRLLIPLGAVVVAMVWLALDPERREAVTSAVGLTAPPQPVAEAKQKPICASPVNPNVAAPTDCIPQHLANLPPDPGEAGKLTIEGVDSDKDGVRDDVQIYIAENWGHSPVAVKTLTLVAISKQTEVKYGEDLGKVETRKFAPKLMSTAVCYSRVETMYPEMLQKRALEAVQNKVTNTPQRWKRAAEFNFLLAHGVYTLADETAAEACGFDPTSLPN